MDTPENDLSDAIKAEAAGDLQGARTRFLLALRRAQNPREILRLRYLVARTSVASGPPALRAARKHLTQASELLIHERGTQVPLHGGRQIPLTSHLIKVLDCFLLFQMRREKEARRGLQRLVKELHPDGPAFADRYAYAQASHFLGLCAIKLNEPNEALLHLRQALGSYAALDFPQSVSRVLDGLGQLLSSLGKLKDARTYLEASIALKRRLRDFRGQSISLGALSRTAFRAGDYASALRCSNGVLKLSKSQGDKRGVAAGLIYRGDALRGMAQLELEVAALIPASRKISSRKALRAMVEARGDYLEASARNPDPVFQLNASVGLALVHYGLGELEQARSELMKTKSFYASQDGRYQEIEEAMREVEILLDSKGGAGASLMRLSDHVRLAIEGARRSAELESAKKVQAAFLPQEGGNLSGAVVEALFVPCSETSGDFYDFFPVPGGAFAAVGDVMGHGAGAAMLMAPTLVALREGDDKDAKSRVSRVNSALVRHAPKGHFTTMCALGWEDGGREVSIVLAGQHPPLLVRRNGSVEELDIPSDPALGVHPGIDYSAKKITLGKGDGLLLFSDGISEIRDEAGVLFEPHLNSEIEKIAKTHPKPKDFLGVILAATERFRGMREADDDRTLLWICFP